MTSAPAPTALCSFCPSPLDGSLEHILLSALGGTLTSRNVLCSKCNKHFGTELDVPFAKAFEAFTNLLHIKSDRGSTLTLRKVETVDGRSMSLLPGGEPVEEGAFKFEATPQPDGTTRVSVRAPLEHLPEARKAMLNWLKKNGRGISDIKEANAVHEVEPLPALRFNFTLDTVHLRGVMKMGLNFLALHVGTGVVRGAEFSAARQFVLGTHQGPTLAGYDTVLGELDVPGVHPSAPPIHRLVLSCNPATGLALFYAEIYGTFRFYAVLSEHWSGGLLTAAYSIDPRTGEALKSQGFEPSAASIDDLRGPVSPVPGLRERVAKLVKLAEDRSQNETIGDITVSSIRDAFADLKEGDPLTEEHLERLSRMVAERAVTTFRGGRMPLDGRAVLTGALKPKRFKK